MAQQLFLSGLSVKLTFAVNRHGQTLHYVRSLFNTNLRIRSTSPKFDLPKSVPVGGCVKLRGNGSSCRLQNEMNKDDYKLRNVR